MRERLPVVAVAVGLICWVVAAALVGNHVFGDGEAKPVASAPPPLAPGVAPPEESCFWSKGKRRWCIDAYESKEYDDLWASEDGWSEDWSIESYEGDRRYYAYDHRDRELGQLRPTSSGGWRAYVPTCDYETWTGQGCGDYAREGKAVPAGRNAFRLYMKGKMVGTARGPGAIGVAAHKLLMGDL